MPTPRRRHPAAHAALRLNLLLLCLHIAAERQSSGQELQPDRIDVGVVHMGATVEASAIVFWGNPKARDMQPEITSPEFVTLGSTATAVRENYKGAGPSDYTEFFVAIKTDRAGEFEERIRITYGPQSAEIPVKANVVARVAGQPRVLIAETPFERYSTSESAHFNTWRAIVESSGTDVSYLSVPKRGPVLRDGDLSQYRVILLGETGLLYLSPVEVSRLEQFVRAGGRLIVAANHSIVGTMPAANKVLQRFGLEMSDTEDLRGGEVVVDANTISAHDLMLGVTRLTFRRASPISVADPQVATLLATTSVDAQAGFVALARFEQGEVVALGQALWWSWVNAEQSDNARFVQNLLNMPVRP